MITQNDLESLRTLYDRDTVQDGIIRRLADAYEEQRDNAMRAWIAVSGLAAIAKMPADVVQAERELDKLAEAFK